MITFSEFKKAVTDNVYPTPTKEQYDTIVGMAESAGNITSKQELAMFLAQVLWESAGLQVSVQPVSNLGFALRQFISPSLSAQIQAKKEIKCASNSCPSSYRTGREQPGKYYFGRGYIQLTWLYNYEQCSKELYGDNRLVDEPNLVSDTEEGAWGSAFWYWAKHCHKAPGVADGLFGASTMAINGALECKGPYKTKAFKRFTIYVKVLKAFKLDNVKPIQDGCYPMTGPDAPDFRLCDAVGAHKKSVGMYHWCNDNCNAEDPNCPEDLCGCEGGNPKPKAKKNETQSDGLTESKPIKVENIRPVLTNRILPRITRTTTTSTTPVPRVVITEEPLPFPHEESIRDADQIRPAQRVPDLRESPNQRGPDQKESEPIEETGGNRFVFKYNEPMRLSAINRPRQPSQSEGSSQTSPQPASNRTQIIRNELGRLIRKRPVFRSQPQNQE